MVQAIRLGRLTALKKDNGRIRRIVARSVLKRFVCKTVARQHALSFSRQTAPFQYALQTKAGTETLAHAFRYLTENNDDVVIFSLDGIGGFDHVKRAAFIQKRHQSENCKV